MATMPTVRQGHGPDAILHPINDELALDPDVKPSSSHHLSREEILVHRPNTENTTSANRELKMVSNNALTHLYRVPSKVGKHSEMVPKFQARESDLRYKL